MEFNFGSYLFVLHEERVPVGTLYRYEGESRNEVQAIARSQKACELLAYLLKHHGHRISIKDVIEALWGTRTDWKSRETNLSELVTRLRQILERGGARQYIEWSGKQVGFVCPLNKGESEDSSPPATGGYLVAPASEQDVKWAAELAVHKYGGDDVIPEYVMLDWYAKNPAGFSTIHSHRQNQRIGNIDILPLKPGTLRRFSEGGMPEKCITGDCLFDPSENRFVTDLYIESFVCVMDPNSNDYRTNHFAAALALSKLRTVVERICNPSQLNRVYALAASGGGRNLVEGLEFDEVPSVRPHQEGHTLYSCSFKQVLSTLDSWFR